MACAALTCSGVRQVLGSWPVVHWTVTGSNLQFSGSLRKLSPGAPLSCFAHWASTALLRIGSLPRGYVACGIAEEGLLVSDHSREHTRPIIRRRPYDDAIEIIGESLRLDECLAAAARAAIEIRALRPLADERRNDSLCFFGRLFQAAVAEIDDLLGMPQREGPIAGQLVAGIGSCARIATANRSGEGDILVLNRSAEPATARL